MKKDLLTLRDITLDDLHNIFELSTKLKRERGKADFFPLKGKSIGLIFAKSSTRTRVSFEVGVGELGGRPLYLDQSKMQVGRGETIGSLDPGKCADFVLLNQDLSIRAVFIDGEQIVGKALEERS